MHLIIQSVDDSLTICFKCTLRISKMKELLVLLIIFAMVAVGEYYS